MRDSVLCDSFFLNIQNTFYIILINIFQKPVSGVRTIITQRGQGHVFIMRRGPYFSEHGCSKSPMDFAVLC